MQTKIYSSIIKYPSADQDLQLQWAPKRPAIAELVKITPISGGSWIPLRSLNSIKIPLQPIKIH